MELTYREFDRFALGATEMHHSRLCAVLIDCKTSDVAEAARFWGEALGRPVDPSHPGGRQRDALRVSRKGSPRHGLHRARSSEIHLLFLVSVFAPPGCGLASALGTVPVDPRVFFLSALGFFASRLLLF